MSVDEPSIQESAESDQPAVRVVSGYSATRRTARKHKRVVRQGTELSGRAATALGRVLRAGALTFVCYTGGSDTFRPPEFHIFRMMVLRIRLGMPLRTDDGDDRAVFLGL